MNGNMEVALGEIAVRAEAFVKCPICRNYYVSADDPDAESMAYAMAINDWKAGQFRCSGGVDEIRHEMSRVLRSGNWRCPSCG